MNWYKKAKKWKEHIPGGRAEGKKPSDYERSQVEKGHNIEFEHTKDPDTAREIAMDHLEEFDEYYVGLDHMEKLLKEIEKRKKTKNKEAKKKKKDDKCLHSLDIHCDGKDDGY